MTDRESKSPSPVHARRKKLYRVAFFVLALLYAHALGYFGRAFEPSEEDDRDIILAALHDFARVESSNQSGSETATRMFLIHESGRVPDVPHLLTRVSWPRFFQMGSSCASRNREKTHYSWVGDEQVQVGSREEGPSHFRSPDEPTEYRSYVRAARPGFSRDGRFAQLFFQFGPTPHGAEGYCFLRKEGDSWSVICRDISFST